MSEIPVSGYEGDVVIQADLYDQCVREPRLSILGQDLCAQ